MGRILVDVRFWNLREHLAPPQGSDALLELECLVDTGATETVIPRSMVDTLRLPTLGTLVVRYANGKTATRDLAFGLMVEIDGRITGTRALVEPRLRRPLIGQTVLESLDLWADCKNGRLISNPEHPESPMMEIYGVARR